MAKNEHLKKLRKGVDYWNKWRMESNIINIDLSEANLSETDLSGANFSGVNLLGVNFNRSNLSGVDFGGADLLEANLFEANLTWSYLSKANLCGSILSKADLSEASLFQADLSSADLTDTNLSHTDLSEANFSWAKLIRADLSKANLLGANFSSVDLFEANLSNAVLHGVNFFGTNLSGANFSECILSRTQFISTSLKDCKGLESVLVQDECYIDFQTIKKSKDIPKEFLLKIGLPEIYINYLPDFIHSSVINLYPVFLSHSGANKDFAEKLYNGLIIKGVLVWYDEKKLKPGDDILDSIDKGINTYDKMILVCSKESLKSWWVEEELNRIFEKERKYRSEKGNNFKLLIPVTIDDALLDSEDSRAKSIKNRFVGDFKNWQDEKMFEKSLIQLIEALNADRKDDNITSLLK